MKKHYTVSDLSNLFYKKAEKHKALNPMARAYGSLEGFLHSNIEYASSLDDVRERIDKQCEELEKELA